MQPSVSELVDLGRRNGLAAVGVASAEPFEGTRRILEERREAGLAADMQFTYRNPSRSTDPRRILASARALVVGALRTPPSHVPAGQVPSGRVARYAGRDHYGELRTALGTLADRLARHGWKAVVVADDNALVDREAAYRAGLGWYGKSSNLLLSGQGSWFVLGSVVTDAPLPPAESPAADGCGSCRRCLDACPTGAIVAPGVVDARRCLAWLLQAPDDFPKRWRAALGDRIYGCDDCQEVCPPNRVADRRDAGAAAAGETVIEVLEMLEASDEALLERFGRWYIARRDPRYLRRNALVVLGNTGDSADPRAVRALRRYARCGDPILEEHARWAAHHLGVDLARDAQPA